MDVTYLDAEKRQGSRVLWEAAFPDDTQAFIDYYYQEKATDNQIIAIEKDCELVSMAHLNPYQIVVKDQIWDSVYLVGVATRADARRNGYMRIILTKMLTDLYQRQMEFCFLMPAAEAIYRPFDFTYIFNQPVQSLKDRARLREKQVDLISIGEQELKQLASWMNLVLAKEYQVYSFRDHHYVQMLLRELQSEAGSMTLFYDQSQLVAVQCEWGLVKREQRLFLCESDYRMEVVERKPAIMARIVYLPGFLSVIGLKAESCHEELSVQLMVVDSLITDNQGYYQWQLTKQGSKLKRLMKTAVDNDNQILRITIQVLTGWLFGYHCLNDQGIAEIPEWVAEIQPLEGVYLDEIV